MAPRAKKPEENPTKKDISKDAEYIKPDTGEYDQEAMEKKSSKDSK